MNKIITISRQFGSGGREVGKRLADALMCAYYDKEIIKEVAVKSGLSEEYVEKYSESTFTRNYPFTFARTVPTTYIQSPSDKLHLTQVNVIKDLSNKGDCVIVGRCADAILENQNPFKVFIYSSDMDVRIKRCYEKVPADKEKTRKEMEKMIISVDKQRTKFYSHYEGKIWGNINNYNLCIDTSKVDIKKAVEIILLAIEKN